MNLQEKYERWELAHQKLFDENASFESHLETYKSIFQNDEIPIAYWPDDRSIQKSNIGQWMEEQKLTNYVDFHHWSVNNKSDFWNEALNKIKIRFRKKPQCVLANPQNVEAPQWLEGAQLNIVESIFANQPSQKALVFGAENSNEIISVTYGELDKMSSRVANGLVEQGYKSGNRCAIFMPFNIESVAIYLGIIKAGMVVVSIADSFSENELISRIELVDTKILFTIDEYLYGDKKIKVYPKTKASQVPKVVLKRNAATSLTLADLDYWDFLGSQDFKTVVLKPDDITNILFSSGTTKAPKAIPWTHTTPIKCAVDGYLHQDIQSSDIVTWTTGMGWMMAPWLIYAGLINGASIALWEGAMSTKNYAQFLVDTGVTVLGTIPSLVRSWRKTRILENRNLKIRMFSSTGEPSNEEDYLYLMHLVRFRAPIIEYCGGTEIGGGYITGTCVQPCSPATFTTPALGLDFRLIDEKGQEANSGEVYLVPPSIGLSETLLNRDHHKEYFDHSIKYGSTTLRKHGDAYQKIEKGDGINTYYKCLGRVDDSMNLGGIKVSSIEIEEVVNANPKIIESAAIGHKLSSGPESLVIFVVLMGSTEDLEQLKTELNKEIARNLNPLFRISELVVIEKLPRTASNKLMRRELKTMHSK